MMRSEVCVRDIQEKMLSMMKWFHAYCEANEIAYYMVGGTLLGAVRHQGFIPWDDDVDVGLPRKDFEKLLSISKGLRSEESKYIIESYHDKRDDYEYPFAKVYDKSTTLIENKRKQPKRGIYIDVFPIDGLKGSSKEEAARYYNRVKRKINLLTVMTSEVREGRKWWKNLAVKLFGLLPGSFYDFQTLVNSIENECTAIDFSTAKYVGNLVGMWGEKEIMPRTFFGTPILYKFEDTYFFGVEKADDYLTNVYGDWKRLPPVEKRVSHHDYIEIDLHKSYLT